MLYAGQRQCKLFCPQVPSKPEAGFLPLTDYCVQAGTQIFAQEPAKVWPWSVEMLICSGKQS